MQDKNDRTFRKGPGAARLECDQPRHPAPCMELSITALVCLIQLVWESGMDDKEEKSVIEQMVDKINDAVENLVNTASEAAMKALEPELPKKDEEQPVASLPLAGDGLVSDPLLSISPVALAPATRKQPAPKTAAKKSAKKSANQTTESATKKSATRKSNKSAE
jgi:hypothetical protein